MAAMASGCVPGAAGGVARESKFTMVLELTGKEAAIHYAISIATSF